MTHYFAKATEILAKVSSDHLAVSNGEPRIKESALGEVQEMFQKYFIERDSKEVQDAITTLNDLIDGEDDGLAQILNPIKNLLQGDN